MEKITNFCSYFLLFFLVLPSFATPAISKAQTYYSITGDTGEALRKQLDTLGPSVNNEHFDSKTTWNIDWHYTWHYDNPSQNPCYVIASKVVVNIVQYLPQWVNQDAAPSELKNKWDNYLTALQSHEKRHENNGIAAATEIENALSNMPKMANCQALKNKIDATVEEILRKHNIWDQQYDIDTNHGKNEGATFP